MIFYGWQLRAARAAAGMTLRDLAEASGVVTATLAKWEATEGRIETGEIYREAGKADAEKVKAVFDALRAAGVSITIDGRTLNLRA